MRLGWSRIGLDLTVSKRNHTRMINHPHRIQSCLGWLPLAVLLVAAPGYAQTPATGLLIKNHQKVVFMGDSITGLGWSESGGYVHLVTSGLDTLGVKIVPTPTGVGGNTSREMLARLDKDVLTVKPDWLLLSCGVNDVWGRSNGVDLEHFKKNMTTIVDRAQAAGIKVMILTPTPIYEACVTEFSPPLTEYVAFLVQFARDRKLPLADLHAAFLTSLKTQPNATAWGTRYLTVDGVHPNPDGHQVMAQGVLEAFGATPAQINQVKTVWLDAPGGATLSMQIGFRGAESITLRQYAVLKQVAAQRKVPLAALIEGVYIESVTAALQAHTDFTTVIPDNVSNEALPIFKAKINALVGDLPQKP